MSHLLRRVGFYLVAFWASITLNFLIPRLAPGNPAQAMIANSQGRLQPQAIKALEAQFGVTNAPLWQQYLQYLNNLFHGNLGISIAYYPDSVVAMIGQEIPWTLVLVTLSLLISFCLGTLLGMFVAWRRGSFLDGILPPVLTFLSAVPYFFLALLILYILGAVLGWFPTNGGYSIFETPGLTIDFIGNAIQHAVLPALSFVLVSLAGWVLGMRNAMLTTLSEDYVLMAEAKGLPTRRVMFWYAGRNAILPQITGFAIALGSVVTGQVLIEIVFSYPGIGFALLQAVSKSDYPLMQGIFLVITLSVLAANFLVDLIYVILDPRVRQTRG
jgi:peptide/nickel transport system permease protein